MAGYPRFWAGIGNILKLSAIFGFLGSAGAFVLAFERYQAYAVGQRLFELIAVALVFLALSILLWNAKGPLVSGRPRFVRWLVGAYTAWWVVSSLGFAMILIGIAYATARPPADWQDPGRGPSPRRQRSTRGPSPQDWSPTGRVGLSGTNIYADVGQNRWIGELDSGVPVQVVDKQAGYAYVIAATGMRGWMDTRTLVEAT